MNDIRVFFDLETTGLSPSFHEIIEIGAWKFKDGVLKEKFSRRIKPEKYVPLDVQQLTGISNDDLRDCEDIRSVLPEFIDFCEGCDLYGYSLPFDYNFVCNKAKYLGFDFTENGRRRGVDVLKVVRSQVHGLKDYKLCTVAHELRVPIESDKFHTAMFDAYITKLVYDRLCEIPAYILDNTKYGRPVIKDTLSFE